MLVMGMISGTSLDGIDVALVDIQQDDRWQVKLLGAHTLPYPEDVHRELWSVISGMPRSLAEIADLDDRVAVAFASAGQKLITQTGITPALVASHGQTVWHIPPHQGKLGYSWQLGRGEVIAQGVGITTVADFRRADVAVGGQGAPLVPFVDWLLLSDPHSDRVVQNIGGISNFTYLPRGGERTAVMGGDNGPGNVLIDLAVRRFFDRSWDQDGQIGRSGKLCPQLVERWLKDDFLAVPPPKSTGREYYSREYLEARLAEAQEYGLSPADIVANLTEFTARAIADSYHRFLPQLPQQVIVSGGGSRNQFLLSRLGFWLHPAQVYTSDQMGINADFKEAIAFAVLGYCRVQGQASNLPQVTGAKRSVSLGHVFVP